MFELEHHQKIYKVLCALKADFFTEIGACFGGGTQLALHYGEYRWSKDIDFLCPVGPGYKTLRKAIADHGYGALFQSTEGLEFPRDIKADQYGVRFAVFVEETPLKFEIIAEGRIKFGDPSTDDWCPVPFLNFEDACSEKLLSNADRWCDEAIQSRDLIDLAILRLQAEFSVSSYDKAEAAYGVKEPLIKSLEKFQSHPKYRDKCFTALQIEDRSNILDGVDLLASDHGLAAMSRTVNEAPY